MDSAEQTLSGFAYVVRLLVTVEYVNSWFSQKLKTVDEQFSLLVVLKHIKQNSGPSLDVAGHYPACCHSSSFETSHALPTGPSTLTQRREGATGNR